MRLQTQNRDAGERLRKPAWLAEKGAGRWRRVKKSRQRATTRKVGLPLLPSGPGGVRLPSIRSPWRRAEYPTKMAQHKWFIAKNWGNGGKRLASEKIQMFKVRHRKCDAIVARASPHSVSRTHLHFVYGKNLHRHRAGCHAPHGLF